jgi:hypothetical protein
VGVADHVARFRELPAGDARAEFESAYASDLLLALDRRFVHRLRAVTGKKGTPLNELDLLFGALMDGGVLGASRSGSRWTMPSGWRRPPSTSWRRDSPSEPTTRLVARRTSRLGGRVGGGDPVAEERPGSTGQGGR